MKKLENPKEVYGGVQPHYVLECVQEGSLLESEAVTLTRQDLDILLDENATPAIVVSDIEQSGVDKTLKGFASAYDLFNGERVYALMVYA